MPMVMRAAMVGFIVAACSGGASPSPSAPAASPTPQVTPVETPRSASPSPGDQPSPTAVGPARWAEVASAGGPPPAREDHTWTADGAGLAWLFGGRDGGTVHGDFWAYDLANDGWARVDAGDGPAPAARFGHEAAWVPGHGLLVFGGQAGSTFFNDLWLFDPLVGRWAELPADGDIPVARYGSCSGVSPDGRFWISHGFTAEGVRFDDTRAFDPETQRWADETPDGQLPVKRCLHVCWWTADGRFALLGGQTNGDPALGDLWRLTPLGGEGFHGWEAHGSPVPPDRALVAAVVVGDRVLIVGGRDDNGQASAAAHWLEGESLAAETLIVEGASPPARWGATAIHDEPRARVLLYGGTDGTATADLWELTGLP